MRLQWVSFDFLTLDRLRKLTLRVLNLKLTHLSHTAENHWPEFGRRIARGIVWPDTDPDTNNIMYDPVGVAPGLMRRR